MVAIDVLSPAASETLNGGPSAPRWCLEDVAARFSPPPRPGRRHAGTMFPGTAGPDVPPRIPAVGSRGDHDLNPGLAPRRPIRPAAVLVGIVDRPGGPTVLLTRRTERLTDHAGQISFPGGRIEGTDPDAEAAALREAQEEIGLDPALVRPIGRLDTYVTRTGFEVVPVVGLVGPPEPLAPHPDEVAEVFEVPLAFVADRANHRTSSRLFEGVERHFYVIAFERWQIWGATAGMLVNLSEILASERP